MALRVKLLVCLAVAGAFASLGTVLGHPAEHWIYFVVYLAAVLLSSGMKVGLPKSNGTMSVNFPFILLGILQLSPLQAVCLVACSVIAQCRIRVIKSFSFVQILFNVANAITATVLAWHSFDRLTASHFQVAPSLAIAATVYFFSNTIPVALVIGWSQKASPYTIWRRDFLWFLPFYLVGAMLAAAANMVDIAYGWMTSLLLIPMVYIIYRSYTEQMAIVRDREQHAQETEALYHRTIEGLAMAIEAKDQGTHRHLFRVRVYVSELGKLMGLEEPVMKALHIASFLHDIGKLAVPEHIINKPGKLTHEEFEKMKIHPVVGADILERVRFPYPVVPIVRSHHEAWDGSGYPDGLKGEEIPIGARLLTVVDCFDALASERPYRKALPVEQAMAHVKSRAGIQFDPRIVELLEKHHHQLEEAARVRVEDMEPLRTDLSVHRGAAPGAGFESDFSDREARDRAAEPQTAEQGAQAANLQLTSLNLITAASREAQAVFELSQMLGSSLSVHETSAMMFTRLRPLIPFDGMAVYLRSDDSLLPMFIDGPCSKAFSTRYMPIGEGLSGWVAQSARPIVNGNPTVEPNYLTESGLLSATSSALSIPLLELNGGIFGVLTLYAEAKAAFSKDHLRILQAIELQFSLSLQNALRFRIAETDAKIDHLTQLPNMRHFLEKIEATVLQARAEGKQFAVAVSDLNSFKAVNDRHGHLTGNRMLRMIADAFRDGCQPEDIVARMGGDEFVFLLLTLQPPGAQAHLLMVEQVVQNSVQNLGLAVSVSTSTGIAFYPADGESAEELLGVADRRMYEQKNAVYDGSRTLRMTDLAEDRLVL